MNIRRTQQFEVEGHTYEVRAVAVSDGTEVGVYREGKLLRDHATTLIEPEVAADAHKYQGMDALGEAMRGTESRFRENYVRYKQMGVVE